MIPVSGDTENVPLIWVALGALATTCGGGFMFLWGAITGVRREGEDGRGKLWNRVTELADKEGDRREKAAERLFTREDGSEMRDELTELIEKRATLTENRVADIVRYELDNRQIRK